jgi:hypothetical protein
MTLGEAHRSPNVTSHHDLKQFDTLSGCRQYITRARRKEN